jgi:hypothetical protein
MVGWLRHSSRLLTPLAVLLVALVLLGTIDWRHVSDAEDAALPAAHDHAGHELVFTGPAAPDHTDGEHCYLCHWLRTLQNGLSAEAIHSLSRTESRRVQSVSISRSSVSIAALLPARAPPL